MSKRKPILGLGLAGAGAVTYMLLADTPAPPPYDFCMFDGPNVIYPCYNQPDPPCAVEGNMFIYGPCTQSDGSIHVKVGEQLTFIACPQFYHDYDVDGDVDLHDYAIYQRSR
jgi:hypothetical protein